MKEKYKNLPLRSGVGIILLNKDNKIFVAKELIILKIFGRCLRVELMRERII